MKKELQRVIELPEGVSATVDGNVVTLKGNGKVITKNFDMGRVDVRVEANQFKIGSELATRRESKMIGTMWAHVNNMVKGLKKEFVYKLEIANVHFPMNVKLEGDKVIIKSLLGETTKRIARVMPNSKVEITSTITNLQTLKLQLQSLGQSTTQVDTAIYSLSTLRTQIYNVEGEVEDIKLYTSNMLTEIDNTLISLREAIVSIGLSPFTEFSSILTL